MKNNIVSNLIDLIDYKDLNYFILIIANVFNKTYKYNNIIHANKEEMFSEIEFAEILSSINNVFMATRVFYSEIEFINYILNTNYDRNNIIVYNLSRDGLSEGKKSLIPSFCDLLNLKYTGSNAFVISLLRNKIVWYMILKNLNIKLPKTYIYNTNDGFLNEKPNRGQKLIVKLNNESASIGLNVSNIFVYDNNSNKIDDICNLLKVKEVIVQEYIDGKECEVLVLNQQNNYYALDPIEIVNNNNILDFTTSSDYLYGFKELNLSVGDFICDEIMRNTEKAAKALHINTYARFDYRINEQGDFYLIDIAGTPYSIKHSSIYYLFTKVYNLSIEQFYKIIVYLTVLNHND